MIIICKKYVFITQRNINLLLTYASCLFVTMFIISIFLITTSVLLESIYHFQNSAGSNLMFIKQNDNNFIGNKYARRFFKIKQL